MQSDKKHMVKSSFMLDGVVAKCLSVVKTCRFTDSTLYLAINWQVCDKLLDCNIALFWDAFHKIMVSVAHSFNEK